MTWPTDANSDTALLDGPPAPADVADLGAPLLSPDVIAAVRVEQRLTHSAWAARHRVLTTGPRPGPWDQRNAPYLRTLMDLCAAPGVKQINIQKCSQAGVSEALRNVIGSIAAQDPDPVGLALPDRAKGEHIIDNRLLPMFRDTPCLHRLITDQSTDLTKGQIRLTNGFILHLMWSGSPSSAASDPMRLVVNDEVDKFAPWAGTHGHAVDLTEKRLRAYEDRGLQINVSTPTTSDGTIARLYANSDFHLHYLIPCAHCGTFQAFNLDRLHWSERAVTPDGPESDLEWAARIAHEDAAWLVCAGCGAVITDPERRQAVQRGRWGTVDDHGLANAPAPGVNDTRAKLIHDAGTVRRWPRATRLGLQLGPFGLTWLRLSDIAAEHLRAIGSLSARFTFRTETAGIPFEETVSVVPHSVFAARIEESPLLEGVVPWWTAALLAVADTQADHFWLVIRAWGPGMRSARVFHGRVESFAELDRLAFATPWANQAADIPARVCDLMLIDSGGTRSQDMPASRVMDVYRYVLERPALVRAIKGDSHPKSGIFIRPGRGFLRTESAGQAAPEVPLWFLDVHHYQDELDELIHRRLTAAGPWVSAGDTTTAVDTITPAPASAPGDEPAWMLNARPDPDYDRHLSNYWKVAERGAGGLVHVWRPIQAGARVDYRHVEGYQVAAAHMRQVNLLPDLAEYRQLLLAELAQLKRESGGTPGGPGGRHRSTGYAGVQTPDGRPFLVTQR